MNHHRMTLMLGQPLAYLSNGKKGHMCPELPANARDYSFPKSLVIPYPWLSASQALSLSDAINHVSLHDEGNEWGPATHMQLMPGVNYPNQPRRNPGSHLSGPLTYWWGATLCPPELNDMALAETVVILMRYAAIEEVNLMQC